jgi:ferrous iron transport protein B
MQQHTVHFHPTGSLIALVGNPNCGKTALFNQLTGGHQKVANYAGVTVERKEGTIVRRDGKRLRLLDLPGVYSLTARSPDERITADVLAGRCVGEKKPDCVVCVVDATNLRRTLRLLLAVQRQGLACVVAINMSDLARARGLKIDLAALSQFLGVPVVSTVATTRDGVEELRQQLENIEKWPTAVASPTPEGDHLVISKALALAGADDLQPDSVTDKIDKVVLHPVLGPVALIVILFCIFQAVFIWAQWPMELIKSATTWLAQAVGASLSAMQASSWVQSLMVNGVIAGLGGVIVFLPQIIILFFFILVLEESGYLPRAAYILDRLMGGVGLSGRSFIPLLSSFACAIPGIMSARTIANPRDRLVTIMIAPLMTCSARLPVYALLIGAFIPSQLVFGILQLQGVVLFALYCAGIVGALLVAWLLKRFTSAQQVRPLMMELPNYHWPTASNISLGLWQRICIFLNRVGTIILALTIALWFLAEFPSAPEGATKAAIEYSFAGMIGHAMTFIFEPIGFNWQICVALIPGLAAREVAVSSLATVYALSSDASAAAGALSPIIAKTWSMATAFSLLAWYVFAPQCLSTLATVKRETGGWKMPIIMASYLFGLAYLASFITYRVALYF